MLILMIPFMNVYTAGIKDAQYIRPVTAMLFTVIVLARSIRTPAMTMIMAVGHYKETKRAAIIEAGINISVSLLLVRPLGINGVLIGTVCSYLYRTTDIIIYVGRHIVPGTIKMTVCRAVRNLAVMLVLYNISSRFELSIVTWMDWFLYAVVVGCISLVVFVVVNTCFEMQMTKKVLNVVKRVGGKKI